MNEFRKVQQYDMNVKSSKLLATHILKCTYTSFTIVVMNFKIQLVDYIRNFLQNKPSEGVFLELLGSPLSLQSMDFRYLITHALNIVDITTKMYSYDTTKQFSSLNCYT